MGEVVLYDYWRSSASYRVRIALNLVDISYEQLPIDLVAGEQRDDEHLARNSQGLVPALFINNRMLTQSLAIIEYLSEISPKSTLLPADPQARFHVRQVSYAIAMEIHPVCNLGVVRHVLDITGGGDQQRQAWMQRFITSGLDAVEQMVAEVGQDYCCGQQPTMADCCLVPQLYNARRWDCDLARWPHLCSVESNCASLIVFHNAHPDFQIKARPA